MPEYLHPGVYIEEIERGPRPIEGVATSTAAFLGETERGPTKPRFITSYNDYLRWFGDVFASNKYMPHSINGFFENGGRRAYVCRIVGPNATVAEHSFGDLKVKASGLGDWGKRVFVAVLPSLTKIPDPNNPNGPAIPVGIRIRAAYWSSVPNGFAGFDPFDPANDTSMPRPSRMEESGDLSLDEASQDFVEKRVNNNMSLIEVELIRPQGGNPSANGSSLLDANGASGGAIGLPEYVGAAVDADKRTGLSALLLDEYRDVSLVYAPGQGDKPIRQALITHCEKQKFRFAVIDSLSDKSNISDPELDPRSSVQETQYAAYYYPWIVIADPKTGARRKVPPGGHMLGIYARTDVDRGVFKAPANETVRGALDLEYNIDEGAQDTLNPRGVNAIRKFPGRGIRLWGARTLSSNSLWKYVSVRRLFIFLEASIYEGTQWVVFEPNDEKLWARVKDTIRLFLRTQWRLGAMMGETEDKAFFVNCDRSTMTQDDILNGRLICEIGIAPVRPAEFVIFRVFQNTAEAQR